MSENDTFISLIDKVCQHHYYCGIAVGVQNGAYLVEQDASAAFIDHEDPLAERLRSLADHLRQEYRMKMDRADEYYETHAKSAWEKLDSIENMPALVGWLEVLGNSELAAEQEGE